MSEETPVAAYVHRRREKVQKLGDRFLPEWAILRMKEAIASAYDAGYEEGCVATRKRLAQPKL